MYPSDDSHGTSPREPSPAQPLVRASDADRAATVWLLQDAVGRGMLTPEEGDQRMAAAFAAVHREDLRPLTADLAPSSPSAPGWRALATLAAAQVRSSLADAGSGRLHGGGRVAVVLVLTLLALVVLLVGSVIADLLD